MQVRNSITLIGHLGQDPETFTTKNDTLLTKFSLATNESYRDRNGNRVSRTEWHEVVAFGKLAEIFRDNLVKGSGVALVGTLRYHKWTDKHDQNRSTAQVHAESFTFLGSPQRQDAAAGERRERVYDEDPAPAPRRRPAPRKGRPEPTLVAEPSRRYGGEDLPF